LIIHNSKEVKEILQIECGKEKGDEV